MLASLILVDYMFFERDDPACSLSGGIGCHLCSLYCCGCIFPCSCKCDNKPLCGLRAPPKPDGGPPTPDVAPVAAAATMLRDE